MEKRREGVNLDKMSKGESKRHGSSIAISISSPPEVEHGPPSHFTESSARLPSPNFFRPTRFSRWGWKYEPPPSPSEGNSTVRNKRGCPSRCNMLAIPCYRRKTIKAWVDVPIHGYIWMSLCAVSLLNRAL